MDILLGLYYFRIMSTGQIRQKHSLTKAYTYKKLQILRNTGWIKTHPIHGYTNKQKRQGSYHRISETGVACLKKQGYPVEQKADDIKVTKLNVPSVLHIYDLFFPLEKLGWKMINSREVKKDFGLDRRDSMQGIFINPKGEKNIVYILMEKSLKMTIAKMDEQIKKHSKIDQDKIEKGISERPTSNYYIFVRSPETFVNLINYLNQHQSAVETTSKMSIMSTVFAKHYLRLFYDEQEVLEYLKSVYNIEDVTSLIYPQLDIKHDGLDKIVKHNGEEKYLVNLMDSDFVKINDILSYKKDNYAKDGRKILVVTLRQMKQVHQELLESIHHIDYLIVDFKNVAEYINKTIHERQQQKDFVNN